MHQSPQGQRSISIKVSDLGKRFHRDWIFRKLTYTFEPGEIYAITGPNGSGKSTLLQILWGQVPPSAGELHYVIGGSTVAVDTLYRHIAIATPYMDLIDEFTLEEQLRFHFKLKTPRDGMTTDQMVSEMQLEHARSKTIGFFSSGMRQRLKLALAFFTVAPVLFLDEPGTNLDQKAFQWYLDQLQKAARSGVVFIASNQPAEYQAATRIVQHFGLQIRVTRPREMVINREI
ncbi:MAG: ABC transporter ATP-binding protein [Bacteroidia bacterium]|nr:ABC transporter ATP-binding protein [Bacteroidia bacterium]